MQLAVQLVLPEAEKAAEHREHGREVEVLPHEGL
jgi:hypothetical protein